MIRRSTFDTVRVSGGLLPSGLLERVGNQDDSLEAVKPSDYYLAQGERLGEAITRSWNRLRTLWERFSEEVIPSDGPLTGPTRQEWLLPLFQELGFGHLATAPSFELGGKSYPISHLWESIPVHLVGVGVDLDRRSPGVAGAASASPHGLVQEFLNRTDEHLWSVVSNGLQFRLLRDNASLTRTAFVEFDLREMFDGEVYSDFAVLWLTCHASRLEGPAGKQVLERWREDANQQGVRALNALRDGVEKAIETLGSSAVGNSANTQLRQRLDDGSLDAQDLYRQILRVVYRILFLLVTESRSLLLDPEADQVARSRYQRHYSVIRLRDLAETTRGGPHGDLWKQLEVVARALELDGEPALGLLPLGGFLWSDDAAADLTKVDITNEAVLATIRALTTVQPKGELPQRVDYANLGAEELGSIYESLLEYVPQVNPVAGSFTLTTAAGNERKTTGSYYTPTSLINELLNSALDPILEEAAGADNPEQAILDLKIVDPAAGSGHFLIAAANRIADRLARIRADDDEPSPGQLRTALRDVIGHCIYAVDINPMAVELAKVALWIEAMEPGKPLTFLDHHIVSGNSLLGVTPRLLEEGVPNEAFKALTGDDKDHVKALKARNRKELKKSLTALPFGDTPGDLLRQAAKELSAIDRLSDDTVDTITEKQHRYEELVSSGEQRRLRLAADAWCAAFVGPKTKNSPEITAAVVSAAIHDPDSLSVELMEQITDIADKHRFHHWHITFPDVFTPQRGTNHIRPNRMVWSGGFDIVLGNPPWERVKLQEKEFFANSAPEISKAPNKAARISLIKQLETENPDLWQAFRNAAHKAEATSHFLRSGGVYPLCGRGDVNTYTVFAEGMRLIAGATGRVGAILPTGIATDDTTKHFFADLVDQRSLVSLFDFENRHKLFPDVHSSMKFCLLTLTGSKRPAEQAAFFFFALAATDLQDSERRFTLTPADFTLLNPNTRTCPTFRSRRDAEITKSVYTRVPVLVNRLETDGNPWQVSFQGMFHMSNDSDRFLTREDLELRGFRPNGNHYRKGEKEALPLYEAKMTGLWDHRAADVVLSETAVARQGQPAKIPAREKRDPRRTAQPRSWVYSDEVESRSEAKCDWLLGFRNVTSPTNERSLLPSIIPRCAVGNSMPILNSNKECGIALFLGAALSSFIVDYVVRQKLGGVNLNFYLVEQFPVLSPSVLSQSCSWGHGTIATWMKPNVLELVYNAWDLEPVARDLGWTGSPFLWDESRRPRLIAELDAAFFHLYGIERDDVDYIMETFPIVKRKDIAEHGSYRTKELILSVYDSMTKAIETGEPYQTILDPPPADPSLCHPADIKHQARA